MRKIAKTWITLDSPALLALKLHPEARRLFHEYGLGCIDCIIYPAQSTTIREAARMLRCRKPVSELVARINRLLD